MKANLKIILLTFLYVSLCFFLSEESIREFGFWFYLLQLVHITVSLVKKKSNYIYLLSPSFLILLYINLSFFFGHYVVSNDIGFSKAHIIAFDKFESVSFITSFFLLCNLMVFLALPFSRYNNNDILHSTFKNKTSKLPLGKVFVLLTLLLFLGLIDIDLSFLGGGGSFTYPLQLCTAIVLVFLISKINNKIKYLYYLALFAVFVGTNFESKREIIYVLILVIIFEIIKKRYTFSFNFKSLITGSIGFAIFFYLIILASIIRGYGDYEVDNPIAASVHVFDYLNSDQIQSALAINFEVETSYGSSAKALDYVYSGKVDYLFGETFLKIFFLPIPRYIFPMKPKSMVNIYTKLDDESAFNDGVTSPIIFYSESFWNFGYFAFIFIYLLTLFLNLFYEKMILSILNNQITVKSIFLIFLYITIIQFIRGSGIELWLLYGLVQIPYSMFILKLIKKPKTI